MSRESRENVIILIGAGGHARACIDVIEQEARFKVGGLVAPESDGFWTFGKYIRLGDDAALPHLLNTGDYPNALVAIGQIKTPEARIRTFEYLRTRCILPVIVSPRAYVSPHAKLGAGTIVMHGAIVNAGAVVGDNCILNTNSLVEHDAVIGDHCHISTHATVNGGATVGNGTFIGSNASVRQGQRIGAYCVIGLGKSVLRDCADGATVAK